jgi:hypothetical protein
MNSRHFACRKCKTYIDAGYRWAYWQLEHPGIVAIGEPVSVEGVLSATEYWSLPAEDDSQWLVEDVLPRVRRYLSAHRDHGLLYIESDSVFDDWVEVTEAEQSYAPSDLNKT